MTSTYETLSGVTPEPIVLCLMLTNMYQNPCCLTLKGRLFALYDYLIYL